MGRHNVEFTITSKTKAKAQKRRIRNESKWVTLRTISIVSLAGFDLSSVICSHPAEISDVGKALVV